MINHTIEFWNNMEYLLLDTLWIDLSMLTDKTGRLTKMRFVAWIKILVGENVGSGWLFVMDAAAIVSKGFEIANWNSSQEWSMPTICLRTPIYRGSSWHAVLSPERPMWAGPPLLESSSRKGLNTITPSLEPCRLSSTQDLPQMHGHYSTPRQGQPVRLQIEPFRACLLFNLYLPRRTTPQTTR